jgi:hypothetical protein
MKASFATAKACLTAAIVITATAVIAQRPTTNLAKYWFYRNRLDYFVVPGEKLGEGQIACTRNKLFEENSDKNLDYGQHGIYTGFYWGVLATEYYLLENYGQHDAALNTLQELQFALNAYVEHMDKCEHYWGRTNSFDGFFIRENVPCDFLHITAAAGRTVNGERHLDLLNKRLTPANRYVIGECRFEGLPLGHPGYIDYRTSCNGTVGGTPMGPPDHLHPEPMSQDEAIGLMMGLALIIKLTDGTDCRPLATEITDKIVRYLLNLDEINGSTDYRVYEPDGSVVEESRGGNTYYLAKGIITAGEAMTGENDYGCVDFLQNSVWSANSWWAWDCSLSKMAAMLAAVGDSWTWTDEGLTNITAHYNWDTFYLLLWEVLHNKTMSQSEQHALLIKTLDQLNNGPCEGTYCYASRYDHSGNETGTVEVHSSGGWGSTYKWCKEQIFQDGGDWWLGNYNGMDYMLLYNLYHIVNMGETNVPPYHDYKDLVVGGLMPQCVQHPSGQGYSIYGTNDIPGLFIGFNSVTSNQQIDVQTNPVVLQQAGNVTYKAEMKITLTPGFHARHGCYFHAVLEDIDCYTDQYRVSSDYPDQVVLSEFAPYNSATSASYPLSPNTGDPALPKDEPKQEEWFCFPNPFNEYFTVRYLAEEGKSLEFSLYNSLGIELKHLSETPVITGFSELKFETTDLPSGNYILRMTKNGQSQSQMITKQ